MEMQDSTNAPTSTSQSRNTAQRRDRRGLTLAILLLLMPVVTVLRLWPVLSTYRAIAGLTTFDNLARDHVEGTWTYPQTPPVGGAHSSTWQNCGIYDQPIPNETAVHSLEHGAVWVTYRNDLPATDVEQLRGLVRDRAYVLLSPYPNQPSPVTITAWGLQLQVNTVRDTRLEQFIGKYMQGGQTPEPGALCAGGGQGLPLSR